jgi:hypothetical protein
VVHEVGDHRGSGNGKDDPLGSHLPRVSRPGSIPFGSASERIRTSDLGSAGS